MQAASAAPLTLSLHSARPVLPGIVHPGHGVASARAQVRAPVPLTFARSVEPVLPIEIATTRMAATTEADAESKGDIRTMGRKFIVPYGLYRAHGYVSAPFAADERKGTGLSEADLELLWAALEQMFDHDRSAARGEMTARRLVVFRQAAFSRGTDRNLRVGCGVRAPRERSKANDAGDVARALRRVLRRGARAGSRSFRRAGGAAAFAEARKGVLTG